MLIINCKKFWLIMICILCLKLQSQNLVPNPSFELANCPTGYTGWPSQVELYMQNWYSATCASPDPMTNCSIHPNTTVPDVWFGYQYARTGDNYMGIGFYGGWYEYIGVELNEPLQAGQIYKASFWVSRAEDVRYASDALGIYFSTTQIKCPGGFSGPVLSYTPQVVQTPGVFLTDATNWEEVSGTFTANGGEKFIVIGCFKNWDVTSLYDLGVGLSRCYYYIDDVSVEKVTPMPLEISQLDAQWLDSQKILVQWKCEKIYETQLMILEKSINGNDFFSIYSILNPDSQHYQFIDYTIDFDYAYYRIHWIDFDGRNFYSSKILIKNYENSKEELIVTPNPATDKITIKIVNRKKEEKAWLRILDYNGKIVMENLFLNSEEINFFNNLKSGNYIVFIQTETGKTFYKIFTKL